MSPGRKEHAESEEYWQAAAQPRLALADVIPPSNDTIALAAACSRLDEESAALRRVLSAIYTRRNALFLSCRIPPEVLTIIFAFCRDDSVEDVELTNHSKSLDSHRNWIRITHVCRRWRDVALNCSSLWWDVNLAYGPDWMEEIITRAKNTPIIFRRESPDFFVTDRLLDVVRSRLPRMKGLRWKGGNMLREDSAERTFWRLLADPAPILVALELNASILSSPVSLPDNLFAGTAPRLQRVRLSNISQFPWGSPLMQRLVSLYLDFPLDAPRPAHLPSLPLLLTALKQMTFLKELHLSHCLPRAVPPETAIDLSQLTFLSLTDEAFICLTVLRSLCLLPNITLHLTPAVDSEDSLGEFFTALSEKLHPDHCSFTRMEVNTTCDATIRDVGELVHNVVEVRAWREGFPEDDPGPPHLAVNVRSDVPIGHMEIFQMFCDEMPIQYGALRSLWVYAELEWLVSEWKDLLAAAEGLRELVASAEAMTNMWSVLGMELGASADIASSGERIYCPRLEVLELRDMDLDLMQPTYYVFLGESDYGSEELGEVLLGCLSVRKAHGVPIKTIRLRGCTADDQLMAALARIVPSVVLIDR
ncbi:hypothetical protein FA95DRAFT_1680321 [Auriscalpium vulgare]|uniref:Uncharacterized protein n=1 Tax=Auriscalpium vulgare TaxID=40419 RepID=A0ACB8RQ65_9AGAM|nr:hypothetical protein FA95DRAFT_1680321 [Auriscalpium vulgare]